MNGKKLTNEEFISNARKVHGGKYNYTKVNYVNTHSKVCLICPKHGEFWKTPANHVSQKQGCPQCSNGDTKTFITKSRDVHGGRYDYSKTVYRGSVNKVCILCPEHGDFWQLPTNYRHSCPSCANVMRSIKRRSTLGNFISRARKVHGERYDYNKVIYINKKTHVQIVCSTHGGFWQTPMNHTSLKQGCPGCADTSFKLFEPCVLYVLIDDKRKPSLLKIGVTYNFKTRLRDLRRETPHSVVEIMHYDFLLGSDAYKLEQKIVKKFKKFNAGLTGFDGATEWFDYHPEILEYINKKARN